MDFYFALKILLPKVLQKAVEESIDRSLSFRIRTFAIVNKALQNHIYYICLLISPCYTRRGSKCTEITKVISSEFKLCKIKITLR